MVNFRPWATQHVSQPKGCDAAIGPKHQEPAHRCKVLGSTSMKTRCSRVICGDPLSLESLNKTKPSLDFCRNIHENSDVFVAIADWVFVDSRDLNLELFWSCPNSNGGTEQQEVAIDGIQTFHGIMENRTRRLRLLQRQCRNAHVI